MVDIATVSVVASAAVALGTVAANFIGGERQRRHETDLDFERRVWERKSEALFSLMKECRSLADADLPITDKNRQRYALDLSKALDRLHDVRAAVEAFASTRCRTDLTALIDAMLAGGIKYRSANAADRYSKLALQSITGDAPNSDAWIRWRDLEKALIAEAVEDFDPDMLDIRAKAQRLLDSARESVRRPKD